MFLGMNLKLFFDNIYAAYETLPNDGKMLVYVLLVLIVIVIILIVIMFEQVRWSKKVVQKKVAVSENTEVLDFNISDIDETNEKTRNLKEITDQIQAAIDSKNIDLTKFEQDQEENSIISYDELMKTVGKKVEVPKQEFSLPDLVRKIEVDEQIETETPFVSPMREEKFKASVFVSPVFGIQDQNRTVIKEEPTPIKPEEESYRQDTINEEELFLTNLINFRKNLD